MNAPAPNLRIDKEIVQVDVADATGRERRLDVFVKQDLTVEGGTERLQDVFAARRFIPVRDGSVLELLSAAHVVYFKLDLIAALDELDPEVEHATGSKSLRVRADLEQGPSIEGVIRYFMPPGHNRLVDYLATAPRWVLVRTPDWIYFINRDRVRRVVPLE